MKNIFLMDLREIKMVIFWTALIVVPLAFAVLRFDWGMYQYANRSNLFDGISMIAAYVPLATLWLGSSGEGRASRLATLSCLPLSRTRLALSRYLAPLVVMLILILLVTVYFAVDILIQELLNFSTPRTKNLIGVTSYQMLKDFIFFLPNAIALGLIYISIPLALDNLFPQGRVKSYGMAFVIACSFLLAHFGLFARGKFMLYRVEHIAPFAITFVCIEIFLFNRRRIMV